MPSTRWLSGRPRLVVLSILLGLAGTAAYALLPGTPRGPETPAERPPGPPAAATVDIGEQVHTFCGSACHAYPPPEAFPRKHWRAEVERGYQFFEKSGLAVRPPAVEEVVRYYEARAPEELPPAETAPETHPLGVRFERVSPSGPPVDGPFCVSHVNLVRLPAPGYRPASPPVRQPLDVLACDMRHGLVMLLRPYEAAPAWKVLARVSHPAHAEVVDLDGDGILDVLVADLGSFEPTDRLRGSIVWLRGRPDGSFKPVTLLTGVGRVADVQAADFRGTGKLDLVVAVFGWQSAGEIRYLENQTADWEKPRFVSRTIDPRHGTIHVPVVDLDGDGRPDFVALISQEHESVVAFLNRGGGAFEKRTLYAAPHPAYGSSGIQLVDLNGDGRLDVLYTNGDVLDRPYLYKPYHGVQWLENKGGLRFEHHPLTPLYGTHCAVAADLTGRGRPDVVAVSFLPLGTFPDRAQRKADAVVVLEQVAPGRFERHSLGQGECDHVVCAAGDVWGTGRCDIALGNFSSASARGPVTIWKSLGPAAGRPPAGMGRKEVSGKRVASTRLSEK